MRGTVFFRILTSVFIIVLMPRFNTQLFDYSKTIETLGIIRVPTDYTSIQRAINAAHNGDTIFVYNGTYSEYVVLNKTVDLVGENMVGTIISAADTDRSVVTITANGATIKGFTMEYSGWVYPDYSGINLNASNCIITQSIITQNYVGISIDANRFGNSIINNTINLNNEGFILTSCFNNSITKNQITDNGQGGQLMHSHNNFISDNNVTNSIDGYGIYLGYSDNNTIYSNEIRSDEWGIFLTYLASNNRFFHNNLINNFQQVLFNVSKYNAWDDGYPSGGNFWSDYSDTDLRKGPNQDINGSDGIGDTPHIIGMCNGTSNTDRYPLMTPATSTPIGENVTICPSPSVNMTFEKVLAEGSTIAERTLSGPSPPPGSHLEEYYVIETTANYDGSITIKVTYNDTGMTEEQELSMRLWQCIMIVGDIDRNFKVDIFDLVHLASVYGIVKPNPRYDPQCDLNNNGKIDIFDVVLLAGNYGKTWSPTTGWNNITTHVDFQTNSIFGVTQHLSIFGVTLG